MIQHLVIVRARVLAALIGMLAVSLLATDRAAAAGEYEPNDSFNTAYGPIFAGTTHTAGFETENDIDFFYFYLPTVTQLRYQLSVPAANEGSGVEISIYRAHLDGGVSLESALFVYPGNTGASAVTLQRGKYFLCLSDVYDCEDPGPSIGDRYSFKLDPPGVTSTYEPFAAACAAAHPAVVKAAKKLERRKAKLRKARRRGASRARIKLLKAKLKKRKAEFKAAVAAEAEACSVPE